MALGRVAGPFHKSDLTRIQISKFRVIPKSHQEDKWRLIIDLLHPKGNSINDGIPKPLCGLSYITIDDTIIGLLETGPITLLAKSILRVPSDFCQSTQQTSISWLWSGKTVLLLEHVYRLSLGQHPRSSTSSPTYYPGSPRREELPFHSII